MRTVYRVCPLRRPTRHSILAKVFDVTMSGYMKFVRAGLMAAATAAAVVLASSAQAAVVPVTDVPQSLPTFNGGVYASVYLGNTIYVGGSFTSVTAAGKKSPRAG